MKVELSEKEKNEMNKIAECLCSDDADELFSEMPSIATDWKDTLDKMFGLLTSFGRRHGFEKIIE